MTYDNKVGIQEQEQRTYENTAEARRVIPVDDSGEYVPGPGLVTEKYDFIDVDYTGEDMTTVTYKNEGVTVATLNITYTDGRVDTVTKV